MHWNLEGHGNECGSLSNWGYMTLFFWSNKCWKHIACMCVCVCMNFGVHAQHYSFVLG